MPTRGNWLTIRTGYQLQREPQRGETPGVLLLGSKPGGSPGRKESETSEDFRHVADDVSQCITQK